MEAMIVGRAGTCPHGVKFPRMKQRFAAVLVQLRPIPEQIRGDSFARLCRVLQRGDSSVLRSVLLLAVPKLTYVRRKGYSDKSTTLVALSARGTMKAISQVTVTCVIVTQQRNRGAPRAAHGPILQATRLGLALAWNVEAPFGWI